MKTQRFDPALRLREAETETLGFHFFRWLAAGQNRL